MKTIRNPAYRIKSKPKIPIKTKRIDKIKKSKKNNEKHKINTWKGIKIKTLKTEENHK